jgi:IMP dehydrogenase
MAELSKDDFFEYHNSVGLALTFDDVRLRTAASDYDQTEVSIRSQFTKNVELKVPLVSAAMDTVTESSMAIAMAKLGGLGVIHAGMEPERQREEVRRVKLHLNGLIEKPVTVRDTQTLSMVLEEKDKKQFEFSTFPVEDENHKLVGILTQNDFEIFSDRSTLVSDAMTPLRDVVSAPEHTSIEEAYSIMRLHKKKTLPLVTEAGGLSGMYILSDVQRVIEGNPQNYNVDQKGRLIVAAAFPTSEESIDIIKSMEKYLDVAVFDSAMGDSKYARSTLKQAREELSSTDIMIGNISEGSSAKLLADMGAHGVKDGQGPGTICTTRTVTGIGTPQVTAVYNSAKAIRGMDVPICADGGLRYPGDISIAIAAGAHSVMMGNMLAGTDEAPGKVIELKNGSRVKGYRGMGSAAAIRDSRAAKMRYGAPGMEDPLPEGVEAYVPYKGSVVPLVEGYIKALRKSLAYVGASNIEDHRKNTRFMRITNAGLAESHVHDVQEK